MKKRLIALLLVVVLLVPASLASAATRYRVDTSSLQVRQFPNTSSTVLASYRRDSVCTIGSSSNGWSYVTFYNGTQGYVQTKYLKKATSYSAWVGYDGTAMRSMPTGGASAVATLAQGTKVTVLSHGSSYDYVSAGSFGTGYIVNSRLSKKKVAASGNASQSNIATGGNYNAWVAVAAGRTINLYSSESTDSPRIAEYGAATQVYVLSHGSKFDRVQVDGNTGYMLNAYLSTSAPAPNSADDAGETADQGDGSYTAYVYSGNKKGVNLRKGAGKGYSSLVVVPYGAPVKVLEHNKKWDKVKYNGKTGYMENSYLQLSKPADAGDIPTQDPDVDPTPVPTFVEYEATVNVNDLNFHCAKGDSASNVNGVGRLQAGYVVTVKKIEGKWAQVVYNGYTGWVHKEFITP